MQAAVMKYRFWAVVLVLTVVSGGLVFALTPVQAQDGESQIFLPSVMGVESFFSTGFDQAQLDPESELVSASHYQHKRCRSRAFGLSTVRSQFSVDETVENLKAEIDARPLNLFAEIDHAANAKGIDQELRPTKLLLFGNPAVGTPLMQSDQTIGIDLPQKFLVWEDECGKVRIGYNAPRYLKRRHRIRDRNENFDNIANVLKTIATAAATPNQDPYPAP